MLKYKEYFQSKILNKKLKMYHNEEKESNRYQQGCESREQTKNILLFKIKILAEVNIIKMRRYKYMNLFEIKYLIIHIKRNLSAFE